MPKAEKAGPQVRNSPEKGSEKHSEKRSVALAPKPREQREAKPIVSRPLKESDTAPQSGGASSQKTHRSRRKHHGSHARPEWERGSAPSQSEAVNPVAWIIGGSVFGLAIVGVGAWLVIGSLDDKKSSDDEDAIQSSVGLAAPVLLPEDQMTPEEKRKQKEISDTVKTGTNFLTDGGEVVKKFLNATSSAELEPLVRTPEVTVPRMREWYATHEWKPPGVKTIAYGRGVSVQGVMGTMSVRLNDYTVKSVALENTPAGYLVDWESWVAWSSMDWEKLFEKRPAEPVEVRVTCSLDNYYNREFDDDSQWVAVKLAHPNSERTIYGYVARDSTSLMRMLADLQTNKTMTATIKLHYPKNPVADNQVIISDYIQMGWVRPTAEEGVPADREKVSPNTPDE